MSRQSAGSTLDRLEQAERLLAECRTAPEAVKLTNLAEAARVYARQMRLGTHAENHATGIKLKAEIRLSELVTQGQERGEVEGHGGDRSKARGASVATLEDLGVDRARLAEARAIATTFTPADIDEVIDEANAEDRAISRRALLIAARNAQARHYAPAPHRTNAQREADRLRQERHRRLERVQPARPLSEAEWDAQALGERALIRTGRLRAVVRRHPQLLPDLDEVEELIRQLAWGPEH